VRATLEGMRGRVVAVGEERNVDTAARRVVRELSEEDMFDLVRDWLSGNAAPKPL
jgi:hypothetical protein